MGRAMERGKRWDMAEGDLKVSRKGVKGRPGSGGLKVTALRGAGGLLVMPLSFSVFFDLSMLSIFLATLHLSRSFSFFYCVCSSVPSLSFTPPRLSLPNSVPSFPLRLPPPPAAEGHRGAHQVGGAAPPSPCQLPEHNFNSKDSWGPAPSRRGLEPA